MTRDQERSLWLNRAVAQKLRTNPQAVVGQARVNLGRLQARHTRGQALRWLEEWRRLLDGPVDEVVAALESRSELAQELRQNSPFAGVLSPEERREALYAFYESVEPART